MVYLVLKSKRSIEFFAFRAAGDFAMIGGDRNHDVPYHVIQHVSEDVSGMLTVNQVLNHAHGGSLLLLTHSGCNMYLDDQLIPQGVCVMEMGQKYIGPNFSLFVIDEEDKENVQAEFDDENEPDSYGDWFGPPLEVFETIEGVYDYSEEKDWDGKD